ncbi:hypothetical protein [Pseudomonas aeruginosa]|uniref:hypothetical protein n=1 Tax=Pseudomonas aeruginosa TaxID=287 RepID=UPI00402B7F8C
MHRYHIHFLSINEDSDKSNRHTLQVETLGPIEYDADIEAVQLWAAKEVGAKAAVLLSWQDLNGKSQSLSAEENADLEQMMLEQMMLEAIGAEEITAKTAPSATPNERKEPRPSVVRGVPTQTSALPAGADPMEREMSFNEWLDEGERREALRDIYHEDQIGPGSDFTDWARIIYRIRKEPAERTKCPRRWPYV